MNSQKKPNSLMRLLCGVFSVIGVILITLLSPASQEAQERKHPVGIASAKRTSEKPATAASHLNYNNGPVISSVKVVMVRYGAGNYLGNIAGTTTPTMESFYRQVVNNPYLDWLCEYQATLVIPNPFGDPFEFHQSIGRGSFVINKQITPAPENNGAVISKQNIESELLRQLLIGALPPPDANTLYMIHFPQGKSLVAGSQTSCVDFCAYHAATSFQVNDLSVYYAVFPDLATGGCQNVCGSGTLFGNQTSAASHELVEAITDPYPDTGWLDPNLPDGEIGDICNQQQGTITGNDGNTYTVQKQWSNVANACIVTRSPACDFYIDGVAGNDANWGTSDRPFRTIRGAYNILPFYLSAAFHICPGNYPEPPYPATFGKKVTLERWGLGTVNIGKP